MLGDPNVAYLLFLLGVLAITAELYHPGALVLGAVGTSALILALIGFASLPVTWAGLVLILLSIGLFIAEIHTGAGALAAGAIVALVVGSVVFYGPELHVSPILIVLMALAFATFFLLVVRASLRTRRLAVKTGMSTLLGHSGVATSELTPRGTVQVSGEAWSAESVSGRVHAGDAVTVIGATGVTLQVMRSLDEEEGGDAAWTRASPMS